jgi:hypothetical protein
MKASHMTVHQLTLAIQKHQRIQQSVHHTNEQWQLASKALQPLFAEAARRQNAGLAVPESL